MASKFQLKDYLAANREVVIAKFQDLQKEKFYNGISLKNFMIEVFQQMANNNPKSDKKATSLLPFVVSAVSNRNCKIGETHTKPYSESNHAKAVNYFGADKVKSMSNAK